ncbi:MAG: hypothetical protein ACRCWR_03505, partial [Saezia sp.]
MAFRGGTVGEANMKKHGQIVFLSLLCLALVGYLIYHEVIVKGKTLYWQESILMFVVMIGVGAGVLLAKKKGVSSMAIKLIFIVLG